MSFSHLFLLLLHLLLTCFCLKSCFGRDTITSTEFIKDPSIILSNNSFFELGFFSPVNTTNRYVGIQLKKGSAPTVVWVANRDQPLKDSSGVFSISKNGNLVVLDGDSNILWSSNVSKSLMNSTAQLSDSGNLVLKDSASGVIIWESFKHPSDIFLPEMKFITNIRTEEKVGLTSWNSPSDPSKGSFFFGIDARNIAEAYIWNGNNIHWRSGPWNSQSFIGIPYMDAIYLYGFNLVIENQTYSLSLANRNELSQYETYHLNSLGNIVQSYWDSAENDWKVRWSALKTDCDFYGACGEFGICNPKMSPVCSCLKGFRPKIDVEWDRGNWTNECVRKTLLLCEKPNNVSDENGKEDTFFKMEMVNLPHFAEWSRSSASTEDCRLRCLDNCSCSAYAYENGIGCMLWRGSLIDIRAFDVGGGTLYLRLTHSEFGDTVRDMKGIVIASTIGGILIIIFIACFSWRRMVRQKAKKGRNKKMSLFKERGKFFSLTTDRRIGDNLNKELHTYDFEQLAIATNNFHLDNKLGKGGFGPVYKGTLLDGQEIAVKRLSRASNQGHEEFINEVVLISKLQHRNLVRLLGCCVEGEEKMLIYEYMPNLSLDAFIFDSSKQKILDWRKRFDIIMGIARGLLYLHRDSRLKIIHRDLKVSNVLLDKDFNPKISDFGMARIFGNNEDQANTLRVVGTYGYMSPEYAMEGRFSEKSDVFSFGVLLLEIISGRKNSSFYNHEHVLSLVGLAWNLWNEENPLSLIDQAIYESCNQIEVLRCIHIGLLCVQEVMNDRPNVSIIISMLGSEIADLPPPKQPGFTSLQFESDANLSHESQGKYSANIVTITKMEGR